MWLENLSEPHRAVQVQQIRQINDQFSQEMTALLLSDRFELASTRVCLSWCLFKYTRGLLVLVQARAIPA